MPVKTTHRAAFAGAASHSSKDMPGCPACVGISCLSVFIPYIGSSSKRSRLFATEADSRKDTFAVFDDSTRALGKAVCNRLSNMLDCSGVLFRYVKLAYASVR